jgi:hypothetical protein
MSWQARQLLITNGTQTSAQRRTDEARQHRLPDDTTAQIDPIGVPWLMIGQELSAAPNGGYVRAITRVAHVP